VVPGVHLVLLVLVSGSYAWNVYALVVSGAHLGLLVLAALGICVGWARGVLWGAPGAREWPL